MSRNTEAGSGNHTRCHHLDDENRQQILVNIVIDIPMSAMPLTASLSSMNRATCSSFRNAIDASIHDNNIKNPFPMNKENRQYRISWRGRRTSQTEVPRRNRGLHQH